MPLSRRFVVLAMSLAGVSVAALSSPADDEATRHARNLAASCTACHAAQVGPGDDSRLHSLAGYSEADLLASLRAYRASDRRGDVMVQLTKGYSDAQLAQIATALAASYKQVAP